MNLRIAAVSEDGKLIEKVTTGTEVHKGRDFVIREMCDAIQALMNVKNEFQPDQAARKGNPQTEEEVSSPE